MKIHKVKIHKAGRNDSVSQIKDRPTAPAPIKRPAPPHTHWNYFDFKNIRSEAKSRLTEARACGINQGDRGTLEYWIAYVAHADAIATAALLHASAPIKPKRKVMRKCV